LGPKEAKSLTSQQIKIDSGNGVKLPNRFVSSGADK